MPSSYTRETMTRIGLTMKTVSEMPNDVQNSRDFALTSAKATFAAHELPTAPVEQHTFLTSGVLDIELETLGLALVRLLAQQARPIAASLSLLFAHPVRRTPGAHPRTLTIAPAAVGCSAWLGLA